MEFRLGEIEHLPVTDGSVDVVISNCVINLSTDKPQVFREAYRVLRPGGRLAISDIALREELPQRIRESMEAYVGCVGGAVLVNEYQEMVEAAGFRDVRITIRSGSACTEPNTQDPMERELSKVPGEGKPVEDCVVSVYVEGTKPKGIAP